jgi:hypothetical protein
MITATASSQAPAYVAKRVEAGRALLKVEVRGAVLRSGKREDERELEPESGDEGGAARGREVEEGAGAELMTIMDVVEKHPGG